MQAMQAMQAMQVRPNDRSYGIIELCIFLVKHITSFFCVLNQF